MKATSWSRALALDGYRHGRVESGADAALFIERLARQTEDVSGVGVGDSERTVQRYGEIPAVDDEFELQDAQRKVCGQCPAREHHIVGQSAAAPVRQDRLCDLLDALVDGIPVGAAVRIPAAAPRRERVSIEMVGKGLHVPVGTGRAAVEVVGADRLDDMVRATNACSALANSSTGSPDMGR